MPVVANVNGEFYPADADARPAMLDILARQVASPVQFVKGLRTLYEAGARVFVEVGPKKALHGFVEDVFGDRSDVLALFTNHPKFEDATAFNQALCGLYAAGLGAAQAEDASGSRALSRGTESTRPPGGNHRRVPGASRNRPHLRRQQRGPDPARGAVHRRHSHALPPRDAGQAHHTPGEERQRRPDLRGDPAIRAR